ncbi:MAG: efflux RND transporter permease subunit [Rhizobiales bacterium]|nr:efflux RND transporter permease subunit [Hyphomicrobiales bacterium]
MGLSELCIRRPVFATVLSLVIVLLGIVSYTRLTVREYPNVDEPVVSVQTRYPGASAKIVESQVTQILEGSIAGIAGIDVIDSRSRSEQSHISVRFHPDIDQDVAASDIRDRVSRVRGRLPDEIDEPVIAKVEADAQPIMLLVFNSPVLSPLEITDYIDRFVIDQLKNLNGVADVSIYGERRYAMRIWIDRERLAAFALTVQDIENALRAQNVELPSGRIESTNREFSVLSRTGLVTPAEFRDIVIKVSGNHQVKLGEVARVELGAFDERRESRFEGGTAIAVGVIKQAVSNPLDVSKAIRALLPKINSSMPNGMQAHVANDDAIFIERSIEAVYHAIGEAIALVVLVIIFFLRSPRASMIPIVTIPISLIATFTLMLVFGFSVNTLTLLAMVLAIGLVVDDAIVVLENIYRHIEHGMKPVEAAIKGTREIGFAVIAMTLTLAAVYAPIAFAPGKTGRLFLEFALTLAGAVVVSGFVALTLTPMMCARLLRHNPAPGRVFLAIESLLNGLEHAYRRTLAFALRHRPSVLLFAAAVAASSAYFFQNLKSELAPVEDRGVIRVRGTGPEGATLAYTSRYSAEADAILADVPEIASRLVINGNPEVSGFLIFAPLKDWSERTRTQQEITREISPKVRRIAGVFAFAPNPNAFGQRGSSKPVEFIVQSSGSYEELDALSTKLLAALESYRGLESLETDLKLNTPEFRIEMDRAKVSDLRLDVNVVGRTLETLLGGRQVTRFEMNGEQYDVMVQLDIPDRSTPAALDTIFLRSPSGEMIQLSNIVKVVESVAPKELKRFNQLRSVTVSGTIAPGYALGEVLDHIERTVDEVLPSDIQTDVNGQSRDYRASSQSLALVFVLALAFIYLVLAAQFESFRDPLIILLTVPLSMCGALGTLWLVGGSLNVYSQIGLVTLVGLITKHGILIVEFASQLEAQGRQRMDAVIEAASLRLRPILMTTGAMVLGAVPLALAMGAGAESRQQIGWVIVGGMSLGTVLTLFVVPTVLSLIGATHHAAQEPGTAPAATPAE